MLVLSWSLIFATATATATDIMEVLDCNFNSSVVDFELVNVRSEPCISDDGVDDYGRTWIVDLELSQEYHVVVLLIPGFPRLLMVC